MQNGENQCNSPFFAFAMLLHDGQKKRDNKINERLGIRMPLILQNWEVHIWHRRLVCA